MGYSTIQDSIVAKLETISNLENIMANRPRIIDPSEFIDYFGAEVDTDGNINRIHTWIVEWEGATTMSPPGITSLSTYHITHRFSLIGYINYTRTPSSEELIRNYAEEIIAAFAPYKSLGLDGNPSTPVIDSSITINSFAVQDFGPVTCSVAELVITAVQWVPTNYT